jgi:cell division septum initiation protein DivIVA|nr:MAG TPA: hypothetical protein [Caudoviricetes sp.]DAN60947.1 MAG TPA: hypothetical protein [Caudoviricetes sp.]
MIKELLEQADSVIEEIKDIENRLKNIEKREKTIIGDSVTGSEKEFPYIKRNFRVNGIDNKVFGSKTKRQYKKMLKSKKNKYEKMIKQIEYELNYIENSEIRRIIRYRYYDKLSWIQIQIKMQYNSEDKARKQLERYLKNKAVD